MGTNYYVQGEACPHCKHEPEPLHIGKSSVGWKFLFASQEQLGLTSWRAWRAYLAAPENRDRIRNEYRDQVSVADLVLTVEGKDGTRQGLMCSATAPTSAYGVPIPERGAHERADPEGYRFSKHGDFS